MKTRIAIIGAGLSGLTLAQELQKHAEVVVFEKARGVGGRMSTRYADPFYFDHGAQFFTARSPAFQGFLKTYADQGHIAEWKGKTLIFESGKPADKGMWFEPHYVATPNMNSLCKALAVGCHVHTATEIAPLSARSAEGWHLSDKMGNSLGCFDWVISTAPPVQSVKLFHGHIAAAEVFSPVALQGCYTLMIGFHAPWEKQWIAAKIRDNPLQWVAVNSTKPGRNNEVTCLVVHSRNDWAEEHIDDDMDEAQAFLLQQFSSVTGIDCSKADYLSTHRWRYATLPEPQAIAPYMDSEKGLAAVSDWCSASRIEDVWLNAMQLAKSLTASLK